MSEKQASSEIAQSGEYLESIRAKTYACRCASCLANLEEAVERHIRDRCAYIVEQHSGHLELSRSMAERIRGKE